MMSAPRPVSPLLAHCPPGLPRAAYVEPDWFAREQSTIWARNWVMAGRVSDLPVGRMRAFSLAGAPVLICRDGQGAISAFHNTCRHRGAELCHTEREMGKLITCPYHAWAYAASDGRLVSMGPATPTDDFLKAENGLQPVSHLIWNGFLLLDLSGRAVLAPDAGTDALNAWPMERLLTGHRSSRLIACNWKVFWENYSECLHCPGIHPELCDRVPVYAKGIMARDEVAQPSQSGTRLKAGTQSWTPSGAPCGPLFPDLTEAQRLSGATFVTLWPTGYIVAHVDHVRAVRLEPLGPTQTRLTAEWYFAPETLDQPGFDAAHVASFAQTVLDQDAEATEMNQRGLASPAFTQARLMPQEYEIHRFHQWVRQAMESA
ncbi:Rieske 2Fe-2S domain-containing protein [bacterium]|nr:Rieske 2Fe-2S domain-containing protein [bacterium]